MVKYKTKQTQFLQWPHLDFSAANELKSRCRQDFYQESTQPEEVQIQSQTPDDGPVQTEFTQKSIKETFHSLAYDEKEILNQSEDSKAESPGTFDKLELRRYVFKETLSKLVQFFPNEIEECVT